MGIFFDTPQESLAKQVEQRRLDELQRKDTVARGLLGQPEMVSGTLTSNEFDPQGNPINERTTVSPATQQFSGFLGSNQSPEEQANLNRGLLGAGFNPAEIGSITKPLDTKKTRDFDAVKAARELNEKNRLRRGDFANNKDQLTAFNQLTTSFERDIKPQRSALTQFKNATNLVEKRGGFEGMTPADDISYITSLSKMLKPDEGVMSDDVQNTLRTMGILDQVLAAWNSQGAKSMSPAARQNIYSVMTNAYDTLLPEYKAKRGQVSQLLDAGGFSEDIPSPLKPTLEVIPFGGGLPATATPTTDLPVITSANQGEMTDAQLDAAIAAKQASSKRNKRITSRTR